MLQVLLLELMAYATQVESGQRSRGGEPKENNNDNCTRTFSGSRVKLKFKFVVVGGWEKLRRVKDGKGLDSDCLSIEATPRQPRGSLGKFLSRVCLHHVQLHR